MKKAKKALCFIQTQREIKAGGNTFLPSLHSLYPLRLRR